MANVGWYALRSNLVLLPIPETMEETWDSLLHSVEVAERRVKLYFWWLRAVAEVYTHDISVSVIHPYHATDKVPLKFTKLIGTHFPQEHKNFGFPPEVPVYMKLPWQIKAGQQVGVHRYERVGALAGTVEFKVLAWPAPVYFKTAI